ncbi:MAG: winged helix-turn-helix domain-containing protein [Butyrivibrio sp.]|nr:winged helix-turn-helix domain-containing protein [Acetatifactor muris]MCM1305564.1 winged helix-turn-helix domain-containing protein [Butyrivibrio sp.]
MLKKYPAFESLRFADETVLSVPGLTVHLDSRKVCCGGREVALTAKEYGILRLLMENRGRVLTYSQIYRNVWGGEALGDESGMVGCHVRHLRGKLRKAVPDAAFTIRCVRDTGYSLEADSG